MLFKRLLMVGLVLWGWGSLAHAAEKLPENIQWETNETAEIFADPQAQKGGTYNTFISAFPLTLRRVGPDSNGSFAGVTRGIAMSLLGIHPNTEEILPELATHWAFGEDKKTMYFKLDKRARWSDGQPLTADDFLYLLEFMRSKHIVAPWYNNYYTEEIDKVVKYDDHTIAVVSTKAIPDLHLRLALTPIPKHYYGELTKDYVRKYNWKIVPTTGPYQIDKIRKGKSITLKRKKDWWAKDLKYFKGRFNVDKIVYKVIREQTAAWEFFKKAKLDAFSVTLPVYWHQKMKDLEVLDKGYIQRMWFHTDSPEPSYGFWLNQNKPIFQDRNLRYAFAHALNMDKLLNEVLRGDYARLHNQFTGYGDYTNKEIRAREFNVPKVEALMKESGWTRGKDGIWTKGNQRFTVKVTYASDAHTQRLVVLKEEAKKAGIEFSLQRLDGSAAFKLALEKKHEASWMAYGTGLRPAYWQFYHSENAKKPQTNNITATADPEMDKLIEAYRVSTEKEKRIELSKKIQEKIHEIGAYIPTYRVGYFRETYWRWWRFPEVPGTKFSDSLFEPFGTGTFWFDKDMKKETEKAMKSGKTFPPATIINTKFKVE